MLLASLPVYNRVPFQSYQLASWSIILRRYVKRLLLLSIAAAVFAAEPPVIPIGADAFRMWDRWAFQRIGARAYMRSTYDRRGGNESEASATAQPRGRLGSRKPA